MRKARKFHSESGDSFPVLLESMGGGRYTHTQVEVRLISLKSSRFLSERHRVNSIKSHEQLPRGILKKKCSANLQENIHAKVWQLY